MPLWHEQSLDSLCEWSDAGGLRDAEGLTDQDRATTVRERLPLSTSAPLRSILTVPQELEARSSRPLLTGEV
jgi:hypothetical protein